MKQVFLCDICGTPYETQEECSRCESFHIHPKGLQAGSFVSYKDAKSPYVSEVIVKMKDDKLVKYIFDRIIDDKTTLDALDRIEKNGANKE